MTGGEYVGALCARDNKSVGSQFFDEGKVIALAGNTIGRKPENGGNGCGYQEDVSYTLTKTDEHGIMQGSTVRRLTPRECERLQGFPDDWTRIPWRGAIAENCPDGPRYKACGNSMAVPVMAWIGERIRGLTTAST